MGCDKTFADWSNTNRADLDDMITRDGVRKGDVVCVRALSDFGRGQESRRIQKLLSDMGVAVQVVEGGQAPRQQGRPSRVSVTPEQRQHLCELWYSPAPVDHVLARAEDILGAEVDRNRMNYLCGPRDGSKRKDKLK